MAFHQEYQTAMLLSNNNSNEGVEGERTASYGDEWGLLSSLVSFLLRFKDNSAKDWGRSLNSPFVPLLNLHYQ